ncbi:MAG: adenylyl-sulfate kinase [Polyangiaceae bacterium]|nr:adenylyl-sulfate kinase [Polyangiaceae bacterium]MCB9610415.1 adenylyl-sulfate kinase [Polyangiaceae bacterium]
MSSGGAASRSSDATSARACVIWITGRPSAGKSRFARCVRDLLSAHCGPTLILDGDAVRARLKPAPGYDEQSRADFYASLAGLAAMLAEQGFLVLVPATAHKAEFRQHARELAPRFIEVFVDAPLEVCEARDSKGLYAMSRRGEVDALPGIGKHFDVPEHPDVVAAGGKDGAAHQRLVQLVLRGFAAD